MAPFAHLPEVETGDIKDSKVVWNNGIETYFEPYSNKASVQMDI